jgi:cell division protein FtsI (penicillin-binding protein 3)
MSSKIKKTNIRAIFLYLVMCGLAVVIVMKILFIQTLQPQISKINTPSFVPLSAARGNIFSDNGSLLAISMPLYNVYLDLSVIEDKIFVKESSSLAFGLSNLFKDKSSNEYLKFLKSNRNSKYLKLKNKVTYNQLKELKGLPILKLDKNKGGLIAEKRANRENPFGILAKRTIGLLRNSNPIGLERAYNKTLSGLDGLQLKQKIGKNLYRDEDSDLNLSPQIGCDIVSTINIDMQDVAHQALSSALVKHDADWGTVILMEVQTGHLKVVSNLKKNKDGSFDENYNHAIAKHSEPGSTFKLASILAGLEDSFFQLTDSIDTEDGTHKFSDKIMRDSKKGGYGKITLGQAFVKSSNVAISKVVNKYYKDEPQLFIDRIYKMGLCTPLDIELPYPNSLLIKKPGTKQWNSVTLPWMSIGYSLRLTPLHMLTFYNAIANQGVMVKPLFTTSVTNGGRVISKNNIEIINPAICSKSSIDKILPFLIKVVDQGTAKSIKNTNYKIAGKTSTTLLDYGLSEINTENGEENIKKYQASFIGFFPADKPKYSCIVLVNNPKKNGFYGGDVAAPIFKEISDKVFASDISLHQSIDNEIEKESLPFVSNGFSNDLHNVLEKLNIPFNAQQSQWSVADKKNNQINLRLRNINNDLDRNKIPSLYGMIISDAVFLLENAGLQVTFKGKGKIKYQSLEKGKEFDLGMKINLIAS